MKAIKSLLPVFALLASLASCGGGGDDSTLTSKAMTQASTAPKSQSAKRSVEEPRDNEPKQSTEGILTDPAPLPNEGAGAVAPGVPIVKGGDNSIVSYGVEAASGERIRIARLVEDYLGAEAAGNWAAACTDLSVLIRRRLKAAAEATPNLQAKGCADVLAALLSRMPQAALRKGAQIYVLSLRVRPHNAFVIYRDGAGEPFNLPLRRENGQWKISAPFGISMAP